MQEPLVAALGADTLDVARAVRSPATVVTNLVLAVQCGWQARRMVEHAPAPEARAWSVFFSCVGLSAVLGAIKHGSSGLIDPDLHAWVAAGSNLALGGGIVALHTMLVPDRRAFRALWTSAYVAAALIAAAAGSFALTGLAAAAGMLPVLGMAASDLAAGRHGGRELAAAWGVAALAGAAWVAGPTPADWFGRVDVAHSVLVPALALMLLGAERRIGGACLDAPPIRMAPSPTGTGRSGS